MASAKPIVIMGAGPAGLTAAWQLINAGREAIVWEADPSYVGGISRTVQAEGCRIDIGGHRFFSKSGDVGEIWRRIMPTEFTERTRLSRIHHNGRFLDYPFEATRAFRTLGIFETMKIRTSAFKARMNPVKPEKTFAQWAVNHFGQRLFDTFIRPYTQKVWGMPCEEISAEWAHQSDGLSIADAIMEKGAEPKERHDKFFYPNLGPGQMWEAAANKILEKNGPIFLDRRVQTIHWDDSGVTHITGTNAAGEFFQQEAAHFLSTMPLPELLLSLDPPPPPDVADASRALRYRNLITVCLVVNREKVFPDTWIYVPDAKIKATRIQNYKNWSPAMVPNPKLTTLGFEYYCFGSETLWNATDFDLAQLAIREAVQLGFAQEGEIKDAFVVRMPKAMPVYDLQFQEHVKTIKEWVGLFANLQPLGRNGQHHYNNQDHAMMTSLLAVKNVQGANFDCWKVNAEAEAPAEKKT